MEKYTTGEIANICNVSVRTVQYYDSCKILVPSEITDGGRRLYTKSDLEKMKLICFLRNIGFSINNINTLLENSDTNNTISLLLLQKEQELKNNIDEIEKKLKTIESLKTNLEFFKNNDLNSINAAMHISKNKKKTNKLHLLILFLGIIIDFFQISTLIIGFTKGIWWPAIICIFLVIFLCGLTFKLYRTNSAYICPECLSIFQAKNKKEFFFSKHTVKTRQLTCPNCNKKRFCIETHKDNTVNKRRDF